MKKNILILLVLIIITAVFPLSSYAMTVEDYISPSVEFAFLEGARTAIFDGKIEVIKKPAYKENENLMLLASYVFSRLEYDVITEDIVDAKSKKAVILTDNSKKIIVDGETKDFSSNAVKKDGDWYVSSEIFGELGYVTAVNDGIFIIYNTIKAEPVNTKDILNLFGIYVSPFSKRNEGGTPDKPIALSALVKKATETVLKYGEVFPTYIFLYGGEYSLTQTIDFSDPVFSLESHKKISLEPYGDDEVVISGAVELDVSELEPVTDAKTLARIPKSARGKVAYMDLKKYNINMNRTEGFFHYLYLDNKEQILSRWPNKDWATVKSVPDNISFEFSEIEPTTWTTATDGYIMGFVQYDFFQSCSKITSVDAVNRTISLGGEAFRSSRAGARYCALNMLEIIDIPGEWFVDRENEILYYYPPYNMKGLRLEISANPGMEMINIGTSKNMEIKGIHFTKGGDRAIQANGSISNIEIRNCEFTFMQNDYTIYMPSSSYDCIIDSNEMYNCSGGFIHIKSGSIIGLIDGNCEITNNHVAASGYYFRNNHSMIHSTKSGTARLGSMGLLIKNNVLQDNNYASAINPTGQEIKIYNNEIFNHAKQIKDGGTIYFGFLNTALGNEVMYNYIHDLNKDNFYCGLYNDDGFAGCKWMYNIVSNSHEAMIAGFGMNSTYAFNLAINNTQGMRITSRMTWEASNFGDNGILHQEVRDVIASSYGAEWLEKYPFMKGAVDRSPYFAPYDTIVYGNVSVNTGGKSFYSTTMDEVKKYYAKKWEYNGEVIDLSTANSTEEGNPHIDYSDDYFVDPKNQDYTVKLDSELAKLQPELLKINVKEIGLLKDVDKLLVTPDDGFKLRLPRNGDRTVQTKSTVFSWDQVRNASKYRVIVATDKEMKNIVVDETVFENGSTNYIIVDTLNLDTVYYWKVEAIGIARQNQFTKTSEGPFTFKTAKKNELSKDGLKLAIEAVTKFFEELNIGSSYTYDEKFTNEFKELLKKAEEIYKSSLSQDELDNIEEELYIMVNKSPYFQVLHYENMDIFRPEQAWTHIGDQKESTFQLTHNADGSITISGNGGGYSSTPVETRNSVVCFQVKFDEIPEGGYRGVYFKCDDAGKGYLAVVKPNILEFQGNRTLYEIPNYGIEAGKWYTMEVGGINTPGGVLQFWRIDGNLVFAELDTTEGQFRTESQVKIRHDRTTHFKKVEALPEDGTIHDIILKAFNAPVNEKHLSALLIGASNALEINSDLYSVADKKEIGRILYPKVASKEIQVSDDGNILSYKNAVNEATVIAGYNAALEDYIFKNRVSPYFQDILKLEKIDENGVNLYSFYVNKLNDVDRIDININTTGKKFSSIEELRKEFAKNILAVSINACGRTFANDSAYYSDILTKQNADYLGINIDAYLNLSESEKASVNAIIHSRSSTNRTLEEIVEQIEETIHGF